MFDRFEPNWLDEASAMAAYDRHNAAVRAEVPAERLLEWQPQDDWAKRKEERTAELVRSRDDQP